MPTVGGNRRARGERDPLYESALGARASEEQVNLRRWIHGRYEEDPEALPGRFRYYEAVMAEVISKHAAQTIDSSESGTVVTKGDRLWKAALMWLRENELVLDEWVLDTTRNVRDHEGFPTMAQGVAAYLDVITLDPWKGRRPLVVVESEASAAALDVVAEEYRITLVPLRGQAGRSYLHNVVAPTLYEKQIVLAIVDLDKVGGDIGASAHARLERFSGHTLDWRPIALTDEQADDDAYNITRVPRVDAREKRNPVTRMVAEVEALGATNLRNIVRAELDLLLPELLARVLRRERRERAAIARLLGH